MHKQFRAQVVICKLFSTEGRRRRPRTASAPACYLKRFSLLLVEAGNRSPGRLVTAVYSSALMHQLHHDFKGHSFLLDSRNSLLVVDTHEIFFAYSEGELQTIDLFTPAGKNFYQALVNLLYNKLEISPLEDSLADSMIIRKEDARDYRLRTIADRMRIGFLGDEKDPDFALALAYDDGRAPDPLELTYQEPEEELEELELADEDESYEEDEAP
jgi:hypothetical protein